MVHCTTVRNGNNDAFAEWWKIFFIWQQMEKVGYNQVCLFWPSVRYALILKAVCKTDHCIRMMECWGFYYFTKSVLMLNII